MMNLIRSWASMIIIPAGKSIGEYILPARGFLAFSGVIMDISEFKGDELRKNDFISIVSHEFKLSLIALMGYAPLLSARAKTRINCNNRKF